MKRFGLAFAAGLFIARLPEIFHSTLPAAPAGEHADAVSKTDMAGIEALHQLDVRVTLMNDPKMLQQEWSKNPVRLLQGAPVDVGKAAIFASDVRDAAADPGSAIVNYKPDIRDVRVTGDWAFEWGYFDAEVREAKTMPSSWMHGKLLRVLHREDGQWKFARVMAMWDMGNRAKSALR